MSETAQAPRMENGKPMIVAGLKVRYSHQTRVNIPKQWERFAPHIGKVPGEVDYKSYGVCFNFDSKGEFDYLAGVEVADGSELPDGFEALTLAPQRYAVFTHEGHVSGLPLTIEAVWKDWLPKSGLKPVQAPCFERYTEAFDPKTQTGGTEIWVPVA